MAHASAPFLIFNFNLSKWLGSVGKNQFKPISKGKTHNKVKITTKNNHNHDIKVEIL